MPSETPNSAPAPQPVLLYDGECGLCNRVVRFLLRRDRAARLKFAALQSRPAQEFLAAQGLPTADFDSLVFVPDWNQPARGAALLRTDGALAALAELGGGWRTVAKLRGLPHWFRDPCYKLVARTRYALFGQYRPRALSDPTWTERFLGEDITTT